MIAFVWIIAQMFLHVKLKATVSVETSVARLKRTLKRFFAGVNSHEHLEIANVWHSYTENLTAKRLGNALSSVTFDHVSWKKCAISCLPIANVASQQFVSRVVEAIQNKIREMHWFRSFFNCRSFMELILSLVSIHMDQQFSPFVCMISTHVAMQKFIFWFSESRKQKIRKYKWFWSVLRFKTSDSYLFRILRVPMSHVSGKICAVLCAPIGNVAVQALGSWVFESRQKKIRKVKRFRSFLGECFSHSILSSSSIRFWKYISFGNFHFMQNVDRVVDAVWSIWQRLGNSYCFKSNNMFTAFLKETRVFWSYNLVDFNKQLYITRAVILTYTYMVIGIGIGPWALFLFVWNCSCIFWFLFTFFFAIDVLWHHSVLFDEFFFFFTGPLPHYTN